MLAEGFTATTIDDPDPEAAVSAPTAFHVLGYTARIIEELKAKLLQFPAGTRFRWCPNAKSSFDEFSPGQREEMFQAMATFLSLRSMSMEPYLEKECEARFPW